MKFLEALAYDFDHSLRGSNSVMPCSPKFSPMSTVHLKHNGQDGYASIESSQSSGDGVQYNIVVLSPNNLPRRSFIVDQSDISEDSTGRLTLNKQLDMMNLFTDPNKIINPLQQDK